MPVRTRASVPADRVYSSPVVQQQVQFKPRRKLVTYRHSTGAARQSRQSTLTQIDFLNVQDDDEIDHKESPKRKRRRTEENEWISTPKYQTQTLTQLEFVSTPALAADLYDDGKKDLNGTIDSMKLELNTQVGIGNNTHPTVMGPPKTPSRPRTYEVPSSQSPASPASNYSGCLHGRSPLKPIDLNVRVDLSPTHREGRRNLKAVEIGDQHGSVKNRGETHRLASIAIDGNFPTDQHLISNPRKWTKEEIQDSDEEEEEGEEQEHEKCQDDHSYQTQVGKDLIGSSDTQEADDQLQSNILQFTQPEPCFTPQILATDTPPRPSQATTVSLSQSPGRDRSSPAKSWMKKDSEDSTIEEDYDTIPGSPLDQALATHSPSLVALPPLRNGAQLGAFSNNSDPPVLFSIRSSQLLTRSQMLPDSLMQDTMPAPPLIIEDSDLDE